MVFGQDAGDLGAKAVEALLGGLMFVFVATGFNKALLYILESLSASGTVSGQLLTASSIGLAALVAYIGFRLSPGKEMLQDLDVALFAVAVGYLVVGLLGSAGVGTDFFVLSLSEVQTNLSISGTLLTLSSLALILGYAFTSKGLMDRIIPMGN